MQIDTSLKLTDILTNIRSIVLEKRKVNKGKALTKKNIYSVSGRIHKDALLSKYNALILRLDNSLSNEEILTHKDGYIRFDYKTSFNLNGNEDFSKPMHSLINGSSTSLGAKGILLDVCDGKFLSGAA